jgi:hypothetical protein
MPALVAVINELTIMLGGILRRRIPINWPMLTLTPEKMAVIHKPTGTKYVNKKNATMQPNTMRINTKSIVLILMNRFYNYLI